MTTKNKSQFKPFTLLTIRRVVTLLQPKKEETISKGIDSMCLAVAYAMVGSGLFSRTRAHFKKRDLLKTENLQSITEKANEVIGLIPLDDYFLTRTMFDNSNLNKHE